MFDKKEMGNIIKAERKKLPEPLKTLEGLAPAINVSRQTLSRWESGEGNITVNDLLNMCEVFKCDFGYLIGEYECRTRQQTDICAETCLSPQAASVILSPDNKPAISTPADSALNELLSSALGHLILEHIGMYLIQDEKACREWDDGAKIPYVQEYMIGIISKLGELRQNVQARRAREWKEALPSDDNYIMMGGANSGQH